ncbi:hypothetical protein BU26DRAFT_135828 [Trematosphaeria pertusa]|uniref:Uncharacterized protein n=1 Tax=Trematosphaeria pertusa TaxID=390896 RepID=A0A6A6IV35_9PLEO|nr:uncharacterized protein BU26DRAFT_135828 [Trematosphaeria pertusa]KAF2254289.1 hypothetical protein BU26DRAFT_135828 [Trematosphaeria pertusa]
MGCTPLSGVPASSVRCHGALDWICLEIFICHTELPTRHPLAKAGKYLAIILNATVFPKPELNVLHNRTHSHLPAHQSPINIPLCRDQSEPSPSSTVDFNPPRPIPSNASQQIESRYPFFPLPTLNSGASLRYECASASSPCLHCNPRKERMREVDIPMPHFGIYVARVLVKAVFPMTGWQNISRDEF